MASATKTEDVMNVFNQLTQVREQIEVIKGQIKYYEESAALSAINVQIMAQRSRGAADHRQLETRGRRARRHAGPDQRAQIPGEPADLAWYYWPCQSVLAGWDPAVADYTALCAATAAKLPLLL